MNQRFLQLFFLISVSLCLCGENVFAQEFTQVADGIEHAKFTRKIKDDPVNVNLLKLDLTKVRLDVVHALDAAVGLETTSSIATRHGAIAAINAGFFKMDGLYKGDAAGILQIDGKLLSESYANRTALFLENRTSLTVVSIGKVSASVNIWTKNGEFTLDGMNRQRGDNEVIIYTPYFHRTTLTDSSGLEYIVRKNKLVEIAQGKGSSPIPHDGYVISFGKEKAKKQTLPKIGTKIESFVGAFDFIEKETLDLANYNEDIVGGVPQLIKNGKIEITWEQEKIGKEFVETRHPRTAVAKLKDGKFLLVTVDGRQPNVSVGMSLNELAEILLEFGAVEAMNLDGGGSTTMFVKDKVVNQTSDKTGERPVSDSILVTLRK
jgi:exopolysaccharide biosynthesis protein